MYAFRRGGDSPRRIGRHARTDAGQIYIVLPVREGVRLMKYPCRFNRVTKRQTPKQPSSRTTRRPRAGDKLRISIRETTPLASLHEKAYCRRICRVLGSTLHYASSPPSPFNRNSYPLGIVVFFFLNEDGSVEEKKNWKIVVEISEHCIHYITAPLSGLVGS